MHRGRIIGRLTIAVVAFVVGGAWATQAVVASELAIEPEQADYGVQLTGSETIRTFTVRNVDAGDFELSDIYLLGEVDPFYFVGGSCGLTSYASGSECTIVVEFAPAEDESGDYEALLVVEGGVDDEPAVAELTARSRPPGQLVATPSSVDFGVVRDGQDSATQVVKIQNDGGSPIQIETTYANGATIVSNGCGYRTLAPLATCEVSVRFRPYVSTLIREQAAQTAALMVRAIAWDKMPPRRLVLEVPLRATAVTASGAPYPTRQQLAQTLQGDLRRMTRAAIRFARGGPKRSLALPTFRGGPYGLLGLTLSGKVRKHWVALGEAVATVDWGASANLRFHLNKRGRRMLKGPKPVRVRAVAAFRASDRSILERLAVAARAKVKPVFRRR